MCSFIYNVKNFQMLEPLLEVADYSESEIREIIRNKHIRPTDKVLNLVPSKRGPRILAASWWLATHQNGSLNRNLTTFNSRAGKLATSPLHISSPRSIRSVIIASGFCEWQPIFKDGLLYSQIGGINRKEKLQKPTAKQQFLIESNNSGPLLLGAVSKLRLNNDGTPRVNTSVITLPPRSSFIDIHHKSFPLTLNHNELDKWLDPSVPMSSFKKQLEQADSSKLFTATPVDSNLTPQAVPIMIE